MSSVRTAQRGWQVDEESNLRQALKTAAEAAIAEQPENQELRYILKSTAERQLDHGLSKCRSQESKKGTTNKIWDYQATWNFISKTEVFGT